MSRLFPNPCSWSGEAICSRAPVELWQQFLGVYSPLIALFLWLAIRHVRPVRRRIKSRAIETTEPGTMTKTKTEE
ncbi:hypothetical protein HMSSN036_76840 [Paenibacillus macerans]|nr:hypothetical protein HMSSN036_76840 [Paenibacillus macerans]